LYNAEGEDLTQEVFLRFIKYEPTLPTHADRVRWLLTVTRNVAISARRKRRMTTNCELVDELVTATK
jgi:DNA-directed RNA polymerase specialized sigma24 family protein